VASLHQVRAIALTGYADVARSLGLDSDDMLAEAGLAPDALDDPDARLPAARVAGLLEDSASRAGCDCLGLMIAERRTYGSFGPLAPSLEGLDSLRAVVALAADRRRELNDVFELSITDDADGGFVHVAVLPSFAGPQAVDLVTAMTHLLLTGASHGQWKPDAVLLHRAAPEDTSRHLHFYASEMKFGAARNGFQCERAALDSPWGRDPMISADTLLASLERDLARLSRAAGHDSLARELDRKLTTIRCLTQSAGRDKPCAANPRTE
jgi:hypothetical protein